LHAPKTKIMCESKLMQVRYETEAWKRLLCFIVDENIHLKNRLCEVLQDQSNKNLLEGLETFLSGFIKHDDFINLLRNDLAELKKILEQDELTDEMPAQEIFERIYKFRNSIIIAETRFGDLRINFYNYLLATL
jgi:hypothetical protein